MVPTYANDHQMDVFDGNRGDLVGQFWTISFKLKIYNITVVVQTKTIRRRLNF
jgi:hypothetical protein